jgi:hypothetical protein
MQTQLSQDYNVDARYRGLKQSVDNAAGLKFVKSYIQRHKNQTQPEITADRATENRFLMSGPGDAVYGFRNPFQASK